jgi:biopolymer transport protein ExbD
MMNTKYILRKGESFREATSLKTLRTWVHQNQVEASDMVSSDGGKTWARAGKLPELIPFFPADSAVKAHVARGYIGKIERRRKSIEVIDMIPMIDMVFLLLIFFALTSTFEIQRVLEMTLPDASSGRPMVEEKTLVLYIKADSQVLLADRPVALEDLKAELRSASAAGNLTLVIRGDSMAPHGSVVNVMDIAKSAGVGKILVTVRKQG